MMAKRRGGKSRNGSPWGASARGAPIPAPPGRRALRADYPALLGEVKERIRTERVRVVLAANQARW